MNLSRREFIQLLAMACASGMTTNSLAKARSLATFAESGKLYDMPKFGNVSLMHFTDSHAQLMPAYYREPSSHIGIGSMANKPPHLVGDYLLQHHKIAPGSLEAYALSHVNFEEAAHTYGAMGGFAHMATLIKQLRESRPGALLLDGGDTWQGSATALWTDAQDMIDAALMLGVDVMTGHWEFTYGMKRLRHVVENDFKDKIDFVAQNVVDKEFEDPVFDPYTIKEVNGVPVAIIGQAFPYTPIANPGYLVPDWSFGIREEQLQENINAARDEGAQVVVLLSHNGMDLDLKLASRVRGLDAILGGHTHDAVPEACEIKNAGGTTLVINSGSSGKFLSVLDLDVRDGKIRDYRFKLTPVFSNLLEADPEMADYIERVRAPFKDKLEQKIATSNSLLFRRGTFSGSFDQLIVNALLETQDAQITFSPGFRWGVNIMPHQDITFEDIMSQTAITYPNVNRTTITGKALKEILEDIADNRFNNDPYKQQGGDMVRVGGLRYTIDPSKPMGKRISDMYIGSGKISASKKYVFANWANVSEDIKGPPIWDVVSEHLKSMRIVNMNASNINEPRIKNLKSNKGYQKYKSV